MTEESRYANEPANINRDIISGYIMEKIWLEPGQICNLEKSALEDEMVSCPEHPSILQLKNSPRLDGFLIGLG